MGKQVSTTDSQDPFASLKPQLQKFFDCSLAENTKKTYQTGEKQFLNFCYGFKIQDFHSVLPTNELILCYFVVFLAQSLKHSTIKGYLAAVKHLHLKHGFDLKLDQFIHLQYILRGIKRYQGVHIRTRLPITLIHLTHFYNQLRPFDSQNWNNKMLWAAICLAFFGFLRIGEFTSSQQSHSSLQLNASDVQFMPSILSPTYVRVKIKCSKTDPFRKGVTLIIGETGSNICAVKALKHYLLFCKPAVGPLFCFKDGRYLTRNNFTSEIRELLTNCGYDAYNYAGHSFRIGAATTAASANLPSWLIKTLGRWTSDCYERYIKTPEIILTTASKQLVTQ